MSDIEIDLRTRVDAFVGDLRTLVRRQALLAVEEVLQRGGVAAPPQAARPGRPARAVAAAPAKATRRTGEKRAPHLLQQITDALHAYIASNAGQTVEQIGTALATPSKELTLPLRKLLAARRITSKGQKRATRYYPR